MAEARDGELGWPWTLNVGNAWTNCSKPCSHSEQTIASRTWKAQLRAILCSGGKSNPSCDAPLGVFSNHRHSAPASRMRKAQLPRYSTEAIRSEISKSSSCWGAAEWVRYTGF